MYFGIIKKLFKKGISWFVKRIIYQIRITDLKPIFFKKTKTQDSFIGIYDLNSNSPSYNFVSFLLLCEDYCKQKGFDHYSIAIVEPNIDRGLQDKKLLDAYGINSIRKRYYFLLPQICLLGRNCKGYQVISNRNYLKNLLKNFQVFPENYGLYFGEGYDRKLINKIINNNFNGCLSEDYDSEIFVTNWIKDHIGKKKIVTITIRNSKFDNIRNTNTNEYLKFIKKLDLKNFYIIIIPDTDQPDDLINIKNMNHEIGIIASYSVGVRFSLYKKSFVNFFVSNGPLMLAMYSDVSYIYFAKNQLKSEVFDEKLTREKQLPSYHNQITGHFLWATKEQITTFEEENEENIEKIFKNFCNINNID